MPPVNDNFANATLVSLSASVVIETDNTGATIEDGEPSHGKNSIWYKAIADKNYSVTIDTIGSAYDTILAVYIGYSVDNLTRLAYNDDYVDLQSSVTLSFEAGETYYIAVCGYSLGDFGYTKISFAATEEKFVVENTMLQSAYGFALTPESSHYIGEDKYLCVCNVYGEGIGCVVVKVVNGIVVEKGTPIVTTVIGYTSRNPLAVWNGSTGALINCNGYIVGGVGMWATFSVSGLNITVLNSGQFSNNMSNIYGCSYNRLSNAGVICYSYSGVKRFITFRIAGSIITSEYAAANVSSGGAFDENVRIANCAEYCVVCFTQREEPYIPQFRVASNLGTASFAISDGQTPFASGAYRHLGLYGGDAGDFLYHCVGTYSSNPEISYNNPCYVAGKIISGSIVFGSIRGYVPKSPVSSYIVGDMKYISQGEFISSFIVGWPDKIFIHRVKVDDSYDVSIVSADSVSVDIYGANYDHLSVSAKNDGNACVFYVDDATKKIFVITGKFSIEVAAFWANRILHAEGDSGLLEKKKTMLVIPGNIGQPYVPAVPAIPSRTIYEYITSKECKKVG